MPAAPVDSISSCGARGSAAAQCTTISIPFIARSTAAVANIAVDDVDDGAFRVFEARDVHRRHHMAAATQMAAEVDP
jgi:hypothetical protein